VGAYEHITKEQQSIILLGGNNSNINLLTYLNLKRGMKVHCEYKELYEVFIHEAS
jgi:hypothetical protein